MIPALIQGAQARVSSPKKLDNFPKKTRFSVAAIPSQQTEFGRHGEFECLK